MKVALCFFGLPRAMELSFILQKYYLIDPLDCDIFIHTWDINNAGYRFQSGDTGPNGENWKIIYQDAPPDGQRSKYPADPCFNKSVNDFINDNIKPKDYEIENFESFQKIYGDNTTSSMYYSIQKVFKLMQNYETSNDVKYDMVIMSRFDLIPKMQIPPNEIEFTQNNFCVYTAVNRTVECFPDWEIKKSDMFIFGNRSSMEIYSNSFETWKRNTHLRSENVFWTTCLNNKLNMLNSEIIFLLMQKYTDNELYATFLSVPKD
jgi:hypothetical protein